MINGAMVLNIDSSTFSGMKKDFNGILRETLSNMRAKDSKEATITLKLQISLTGTAAPDFSFPEPNAMRNVLKPRFDHKVSSVMQVKNETSGVLKGEYELAWSEEHQDYIMIPINDGQQSFFDHEDSPVDVVDAEVVGAEVVEDATEPLALPANPLELELVGIVTGDNDGYGYDKEEGNV